jgi:hypothetical protein
MCMSPFMHCSSTHRLTAFPNAPDHTSGVRDYVAESPNKSSHIAETPRSSVVADEYFIPFEGTHHAVRYIPPWFLHAILIELATWRSVISFPFASSYAVNVCPRRQCRQWRRAGTDSGRQRRTQEKGPGDGNARQSRSMRLMARSNLKIFILLL